MTKKRLALVGMIVAITAGNASADWHSFWHRFNVDYHRNNAWPHPFREMAAAQTRAPFEVQRHNGWQLHNTISHELFRPGDGGLTYAGQQQLVNIITVVPVEQRTVFVVRGASQAETEARLASVQSSLERMTQGGQTPPVMIVDRAPATNSGAMAAAVNREWLKVIPKPELPSREGPTVSGGGN